MRRQGRSVLFGNVMVQVVKARLSRSLVFKADGVSLATVVYVRSSDWPAFPMNASGVAESFSICVYSQRHGLHEVPIINSRNTTLATSKESLGINQVESSTDPRFEVVQFSIPRTTMEAFIEYAELPSIRDLNCPEMCSDPVLIRLAELLLPLTEEDPVFSDLFLDLYVQMLCGQLALSYGVASCTPTCYRGGLAPWQRRRTLELLEKGIGGGVPLKRLAEECVLSVSHFCRCFRATFGTSAHQYILKKRIEQAQNLLLQSELSLVAIAIESGFSDQAAFTRAFASAVGTPPARWRAEQRVRTRMNTMPYRCDGLAMNWDVEGSREVMSQLDVVGMNADVFPVEQKLSQVSLRC
jgi:AraC-like DNA-binding protein